MRLKVRLKDKRTGEIVTFANIGLNNDVDRSDGTDEDVFFALKEDRFYSLAELNERFEDAPEEKKYGGRVPEQGDDYWLLSCDGEIYKDRWDGTQVDKGRFETGSAFWTEEGAEKELARRKAYVVLKEDTKGFKPNWENESEEKWYISYRYDTDSFVFDWHATYIAGEKLYFATREDAEASIKAHSSEWKTWLGVEI